MFRTIWERITSPKGRRWLRIASYGLIAVGILLLVIAGVNLGYRQWERTQLQARLTRTALTATPLAVTVTPLPPTAEVEPTETLPPAETEETSAATPEATATAAIIAAASPTSERLSPTPEPASSPTTAPTPIATPLQPGEPPVRIVIPDLMIDAPVVEMGWEIQDVGGTRTSVWRLADIAGGVAGHLVSSALPGQADNVVIAGHHNIEGQVFKNISNAWSDDEAEVLDDGLRWRSHLLDGRTIVLHDAIGQTFNYTVQGMYKLKDRDVPLAERLANGRFMGLTTEPTLTLVTCWPFSNNTHRIVVVATLAGGEG